MGPLGPGGPAEVPVAALPRGSPLVLVEVTGIPRTSGRTAWAGCGMARPRASGLCCRPPLTVAGHPLSLWDRFLPNPQPLGEFGSWSPGGPEERGRGWWEVGLWGWTGNLATGAFRRRGGPLGCVPRPPGSPPSLGRMGRRGGW